ncbi:MAG: 50S ribosomal protein L4 [Candidatus Giovannonibacteria bacterium GW2011_GWB1_45_9b]|uniref:Large ribosomal subunit protein uL4 n=7 Tax=Candidatus Giovannoniibacteriota TaxID=1752738 RepID=A0A1F5X170_9BACT|nr:MAG: 50S ribosomal protein L4 [Candidatus Giovannonibacteria bacterium GW2011_GWC2_44_8]KKU05201.1 MAG: 50S ribosomal protein L4 [Candidatus Giovannonibacteria bacterium GW2011_GWA2_45_21]KKU16731.1 MAG: 50S ribosomal protein L4 [Candidatus Giovannonibacteria bacterium GW2011_GWB1_45_9b]OGF73788.1 MAG: 50S ribosomal protein L4 [Candidatus Giovannonibacteria bacterium RIFCSPHIGHO2_02_43_16]OGF81645.1 MAG: 50S ribosomal protein L4 [Candidatus Giovannonibacteria bacterium RIFCSPHIGHO2_12_44_12]
MEAKIYDNKGKEKGTLTLSASVFGFPWNAELVRQVFLSERANARKVLAHTKDRSEVSGGGKKPWQQKGTGRARHGSSRSPIWVGGGISHGPRKDRDYMEKINKKAKRKAVLAILSQKLKDGEIFFMDDLSLPEAKTKNAREILGNMPLGNSSALVILPRKDAPTWRALRNLKNVSIKEARNLNASDLLSNKFLIIPKDASKVLEETFLK